jgi:hypothetical protein
MAVKVIRNPGKADYIVAKVQPQINADARR